MKKEMKRIKEAGDKIEFAARFFTRELPIPRHCLKKILLKPHKMQEKNKNKNKISFLRKKFLTIENQEE